MQLADPPPGEPAPRPEGARVLAVANEHACAIVGGGEARCWGLSEVGALGAPVVTEGLVRVAGLADLQLVAVGENHSCAARRDHTVHCWGEGEDGQLGDGVFVDQEAVDEHSDEYEDDYEEPTHHRATPEQLEGITGEVLGLALTGAASCARTSEGLWCWGSLPNPASSRDPIVPQPLRLLTGPMRAVDGEDDSLCAVDDKGAVHCWGPVAERYRDGAFVKVPYDVDDDREPAAFSAGGPLWQLGKLKFQPKAIAVGSQHACLVAETDELWCWGSNEHGQLGDGTTRDRVVPVKVRGLPRPPVQVVAGFAHTCARVADGAVLCWGSKTAPAEHGTSEKPRPVVGLAPYTGPAAKIEAAKVEAAAGDEQRGAAAAPAAGK